MNRLFDNNGHTQLKAQLADGTKVSPISLTDVEKLALRGIQARERELQAQILVLQHDFQNLCHIMEEAHGLPRGSIGSTHALDIGHFLILPVIQHKPGEYLPPPAPDADGNK